MIAAAFQVAGVLYAAYICDTQRIKERRFWRPALLIVTGLLLAGVNP